MTFSHARTYLVIEFHTSDVRNHVGYSEALGRTNLQSYLNLLPLKKLTDRFYVEFVSINTRLQQKTRFHQPEVISMWGYSSLFPKRSGAEGVSSTLASYSTLTNEITKIQFSGKYQKRIWLRFCSAPILHNNHYLLCSSHSVRHLIYFMKHWRPTIWRLRVSQIFDTGKNVSNGFSIGFLTFIIRPWQMN